MTLAQLQPTTVVPDVDEAWTLYANIFAEVNNLAAQRHLMTSAEFHAIYHDPRVLKFYTRDEAGGLAGMSVLTQDLDAWPLISPTFFARRWPDHYARKAIWYVGFVGVAPNGLNGFRDLVGKMYPHVIGNAGVAVMDFCTYNVTHRRLPAVTLKLLSWVNPAAAMETVDAQQFVVYTFDQIQAGA